MTVPLREPVLLEHVVRALGGVLDPGLEGRRIVALARPEDVAAEDQLVLFVRRGLPEPEAGVLLTSTSRPLGAHGRRYMHDEPWQVVRTLLEAVADEPSDERTSATVEPGAEVHPTAKLGHGAIVRAGARIGEACVVGAYAVIFPRVVLGARVVIGEHAVIGRPGFGWVFDQQGHIERIPHLGGVVVEDDVEIGAHATVDAGVLGPTRLERGVKLDAHVHVAHNVTLGAGTVVAAQSGFAGSARIGKRVLVGGQVGVTDHAEIGDFARLAARSGVIGPVPAGATYAGYPAVPRVQWLRAHARLYRRKR